MVRIFLAAQGVFAFPSFDRYDDHHQDRGREDHEDDDHQGGVEKGYVFSNSESERIVLTLTCF